MVRIENRKVMFPSVKKIRLKTALFREKLGMSIIEWMNPKEPSMYLLDIYPSFPEPSG